MTCRAPAPNPPGYGLWVGPVPPALTQWAVDLLGHVRDYDFDTIFSMPYAGQQIVARVDAHTWTYRKGVLVEGLCIKGISLYRPKAPTLGALSDSDLSTPDPNAAVFIPSDAIDWKLVAGSGFATAAVIGAFFWALRHAGSLPKLPSLK